MGVLLQEVDAPRGCEGGESRKNGLDILILEAWAGFLAAWYRVAALSVDCKFQCSVEAVLAEVMASALHVQQWARSHLVWTPPTHGSETFLFLFLFRC
jgi:hypothetical protein